MNLRVGRTWWSVPMIVLTGCATPARSANDVAPAESDQSAAGQAGDTNENVAALNGSVLERAAYVRVVLRRNPSVEAARQGWRAAIERVRQAGAFQDPVVALEVAPLSIGSSSARLGYSAMISQRLPWPGKRGLEEAAAKAEADAGRSDYEAARRELALSASLLYDQYFVAARSLEINREHIALMRTMQAAAAAQYETGRASAQDSLQAEFELAHMEHDTVVLATEREVTVAQMNELLHRAPELPLPPPPAELPLPPAPDAGELQRLESQAASQRPDIRAAQQHAGAAQARAQRAERDGFPDFTVSTSYNSMWDMPEHRWSIGLSFDLPILTGRRHGAADEARATRAQYDAEARRLGDMARTQVAISVKQLAESAHVLHLYAERLVPIARDRVDAARNAFTASQAPIAAVIEAEKTLRQVELEQQTARADYDRRRGELDRALGRIPGLDDQGGAR